MSMADEVKMIGTACIMMDRHQISSISRTVHRRPNCSKAFSRDQLRLAAIIHTMYPTDNRNLITAVWNFMVLLKRFIHHGRGQHASILETPLGGLVSLPYAAPIASNSPSQELLNRVAEIFAWRNRVGEKYSTQVTATVFVRSNSNVPQIYVNKNHGGKDPDLKITSWLQDFVPACAISPDGNGTDRLFWNYLLDSHSNHINRLVKQIANSPLGTLKDLLPNTGAANFVALQTECQGSGDAHTIIDLAYELRYAHVDRTNLGDHHKLVIDAVQLLGLYKAAYATLKQAARADSSFKALIITVLESSVSHVQCQSDQCHCQIH
jgi:hypothetical protein